MISEALFNIILYGIIFIISLLYIVLVYNRKNIINNWDQYKCNPLVIPFASYFDKNTFENMNGCMWNGFKSNFGIIIKPFTYMTDTIKLIIRKLFDQLNSIRTILKPIRNFVESATAMVYKKIEGIMNLTMFTFLKMNNIMKRSFANFRLMIYALEASQYSIQSTWDGPIGKISRFWAPPVDFFWEASEFFCFEPNTKVIIESGLPIEINKLKIGDKLYNNNTVIGILTMVGVDNYYDYNGVIVSGNHLVLYKKSLKWCEVSVAPKSNYVYRPDIKNVICLITANNTIPILDTFGTLHYFADYHETCDEAVMRYQRSLIYNKLSISLTEIPTGYNLIGSKTPIYMNDNTYIDIVNIKIGDRLYNNNIVVGIIKQYVNDIDVIKINDNIYTASNIITYNKQWKCINAVYNNNIICKYSGLMYNIITNMGIFQTNDFIMRDYLELHSSQIYDKVREFTLSILNFENT